MTQPARHDQADYYVRDDEDIEAAAAVVQHGGLHLTVFQEETGELMLRFAADASARLCDFATIQELAPFAKLEPNMDGILRKTVDSYLRDANGESEQCTPLEHALLHGYTLNQAISMYTRVIER